MVISENMGQLNMGCLIDKQAHLIDINRHHPEYSHNEAG